MSETQHRGGHLFSFCDEAADDLRAEICCVISVPSFLGQAARLRFFCYNMGRKQRVGRE